MPLEIEVRAFSGGSIEEVTTWGTHEAAHKRYDQVYLLAGVNNLTIHLGYRKVKPRFTHWTSMVRRMMMEYYMARTRLYRLTDKVVICDLVALHLATYNRNGEGFHYYQHIIDCATIRVNEYVEEMNREASVYSPRLADHIHKSRHPDHPIHHRYSTTLRDGLHFTLATTTKYSIMLLRNILDLRRSQLS